MSSSGARRRVRRTGSVEDSISRALASLRAGSDPDDVYGAMQRLARIGTPAVEPLIRILRDAKERPVVRARAGESLEMIGDRRAVQPLIDVLDDPDVELRWSAIGSLGRLRAAEAVPALRRLAAADAGGFSITTSLHVTVRQAAAEALARIEGQDS